ncbi:hypothetical protein L9F63_009642, partial [Diploptera punctata]
LAKRHTVTVKVTQGWLRGERVMSSTGITYYSFLGIPYARPPVGPFRFKAPQPAERWKGVRDALTEGDLAPQIDILRENIYVGKENCLFLNAYSSTAPCEGDIKPVVVWIPGGSFTFGSGNKDMAGPDRLMNGRIILVSINYRLGALGFLSTGDEVIPGNNGLKDQVMALRWVQQNIAHFGGDPSNVTIFGMSAGAASVHYHLLSPMSKGLFHRAIAHSGSALNPWAFDDSKIARRKAFKLGETLGCRTDCSKTLLEFLSTITARTLVNAVSEILADEEKIPMEIYFKPTNEHSNYMEDTFISAPPKQLMSDGNFQTVPFITGVTSMEAMYTLLDANERPCYYKWTNDDFEHILTKILNLPENKKKENNALSSKIKNFYFKETPICEKTKQRLIELYSDLLFVEGVYRTAKELSRKSASVFLYQFSYEGEYRLNKIFFKEKPLPGTCHGDEFIYFFDAFFTEALRLNFDYECSKISSRMINMWTDFATTGKMADTEIVNVIQGSLRGKKVTAYNGVTYYSFQGIPYAKPPVGPLRFEAPQSPEPWDGIRDASSPGNTAPQVEAIILNKYIGDEDCLFLNVYTPKLPSLTDGEKKAVMVWIHGGAFNQGSGNEDMYGPDHLIAGDVVIVTINYRLGPLGFLYTEDVETSGNIGLKDQVMALKWVQQNIAKFGGDPNNVTIFGESAGGASVHCQLLSPMSKGLFHKAIAQSGSVLNPWALVTNPRERAFRLGAALGCHTTDSKKLVEFLRTVPPKELIEAAETSRSPEEMANFDLCFTPCVENAVAEGDEKFLPSDPHSIMAEGKFNQVPCIIGFTSHEGMMMLRPLNEKPEMIEMLTNKEDSIIPYTKSLKKNTTESKEIGSKIRKYYFGEKYICKETLPELVDLYSDAFFIHGVKKCALLQLSHSTCPMYMYQFSFDEGLEFVTQLLAGSRTPGTCHGVDLPYLFKGFYTKQEYLKPDTDHLKIVKIMVKLWTNFAKTG